VGRTSGVTRHQLKFLGPVKKPIGTVQEMLGILLAIPAHDRGSAALTGGHRAPQPVEDLVSAAQLAIGQQEPELIAAPAAQHVDVADPRAPVGGDLDQQAIGGEMPV
jgi:hypothetical protein